MNEPEYFAMVDKLVREAGFKTNGHPYFNMHKSRLGTTISHFNLWNLSGKNVLDIGAYWGFTPFLLHENGNKVTVLEGDDPDMYPLKPLYARYGIEIIITNLLDSFGDDRVEMHRFPFADNQFDMITCWETMEHFNFNPVGFVKDLHRILKPGGIATLTVPNRAKLDHRIKMAIGRPMGATIEHYYEVYGSPTGALCWHWREYTLKEFVELFARQNFQIVSAAHLTIFQDRAEMSLLRHASRFITRAACAIIPSWGTNCLLTVKK